MTRDDVIRMAKESGLIGIQYQPIMSAIIEDFANRIIAADREECAKACYVVGYEENAMGKGNAYVAEKCAEAIRVKR